MSKMEFDPITLAALSGPRLAGPPGPLPADASGYWRKGLWYNTVATQQCPVGLCVAVRSFHNEGTDYINLWRPENLVNLLAPTSQYKTCVIAKVDDLSVAQVIFGFGGFTTSEKQLQLSVVAGYVEAVVGGVLVSRANAASLAGQYIKIELTKYATDAQLVLNGSIFGTRLVAGPSLYNGNIYIGGRTDGVSANFEGDTLGVKLYDVNGTLVDAFDPNQDSLWNGGATGYTVAGAPFSVSDGTPLGCTDFSWVSLSDALAWDVL